RPVYYKNLGRYKKVLQNRNFLLKDGITDQALLGVYDEELADYGARIILDRARFIEKLNEISRGIHERITDGKEVLEISYESNVSVKEEFSLQKEEFLNKLTKGISRDAFKGNTESGPHKDDLKIQVNGIDIRHYGSQGQQRTAALSLKLAEIYLIKEETGEDAILLLDDVLSELDVQRQTFLLNRLHEIQIFITTTEISQTLSDNLTEGYIFTVENGSVKLSETIEKCLT
ncbi:MAG: DNA replication and repair protein RecF, partial [Firmicutes bacterium]|nr:DNA replication and repair protein RecF [Bacillota bacterium]